MNRRSILNCLGLGLGASAAPLATVVIAKAGEPHRPPSGRIQIRLEERQIRIGNDLGGETAEDLDLALSVGADGRLWTKSGDGRWRRVAMEGL